MGFKVLFSFTMILTLLHIGSYAQCNVIDAVTSASFRITGGEACSTYANLKWSYKEKNGEMTIKWGTSTSYGSSKSVYSSNPVKLTGLTPNTTYHYNVTGLWKGRTYQYTKSSFKTSGSSAPVNNPPEITSASAVTCTTGKVLTYKISATDKDNDPITYSLSSTRPGWVEFSSPVLTLKPVTGSTSTSIRVFASDNKNGFDTLELAVTIVTPTAVLENGVLNEMVTLIAGNTPIFTKLSKDRTLHLTLFTLNGKIIMNKVLRMDDYSRSVRLVPENSVPGVYLLQVANQAQSRMHQICIR